MAPCNHGVYANEMSRLIRPEGVKLVKKKGGKRKKERLQETLSFIYPSPLVPSQWGPDPQIGNLWTKAYSEVNVAQLAE